MLVLLWQDLWHICKHCQTSPADIHQVGYSPVSLIYVCAASFAVRQPFIFRHNMHTGRWLSKISAVWDPKQEDCFVAGSMLRPRRLQVFHESGWEQHTFTDQDNFNTVLPVTAFHPTRNALLGGNASGRLHVFTDWDLWLLSVAWDQKWWSDPCTCVWLKTKHDHLCAWNALTAELRLCAHWHDYIY